MGKDNGHERVNQAQSYYLERRAWIENLCRELLNRSDDPNHLDSAEDVAQKVFENCGKISDEQWEAIDNKDGYIYKIVKNEVKQADIERQKRREEALDPDEIDRARLGQNPSEANQSAAYVKTLYKEIYALLTPEEQELFDQLCKGNKAREIASELGLTYDCARQRTARLRRKLISLLETGGASSPVSRPPGSNNPQSGTSSASLTDAHD